MEKNNINIISKIMYPINIARISKPQPKKNEPNNNGGFNTLRDKLMKNMQTRDKPVENKVPSEPIKVIKSDAMKNIVEEMNKHHEENKQNNINNEPTQVVVVCGGGPGVPPPPPPPPPPIFDPSKVKKRPNKPIKKKEPPKPSAPVSSAPSLKDQLMKVALKKVGK